jgi:hypothetical protein
MHDMACLVCDHSERFHIENDLKRGTPKARVAKTYGISRTRLVDHIKAKHEEKTPAKEPADKPSDDPEDKFPDDYTIRLVSTKREMQRIVDRHIAEFKYRGAKTIAKLARLWRDQLGNDAEMRVAEMVAESAKKHRITRGPKDVRKELLIVEVFNILDRCKATGDWKAALSATQQLAELDNLKEDKSLDRAVLVQIVNLIEHEAPHLKSRVEERLAQFEIVVDQAKAVLEGEMPRENHFLAPREEPIFEAPATPRSNGEDRAAGIDTGIPSSDGAIEAPSSE